jgi:hypothetical protein
MLRHDPEVVGRSVLPVLALLFAGEVSPNLIQSLRLCIQVNPAIAGIANGPTVCLSIDRKARSELLDEVLLDLRQEAVFDGGTIQRVKAMTVDDFNRAEGFQVFGFAPHRLLEVLDLLLRRLVGFFVDTVHSGLLWRTHPTEPIRFG